MKKVAQTSVLIFISNRLIPPLTLALPYQFLPFDLQHIACLKSLLFTFFCNFYNLSTIFYNCTSNIFFVKLYVKLNTVFYKTDFKRMISKLLIKTQQLKIHTY